MDMSITIHLYRVGFGVEYEVFSPSTLDLLNQTSSEENQKYEHPSACLYDSTVFDGGIDIEWI